MLWRGWSRGIRLILGTCVVVLLGLPETHAVIETYEFSSAELEQRYRMLSQELRCPKCQNQNIADSNAPIARDLRAELARQLERGANDEEILAFMVERYGEFVRYRPEVNDQTLVLWIGPWLLLLLGAGIVLRSVRRSGEGPQGDANAITAARGALRKRLHEQETE
jgi:cytochrome c-type biogenesis protein CcmH